MIPQLNRHSLEFPDPTTANEDGIVAWGGDLTPSRLIRAYQNGIFPWYSKDDPIIWWSVNPRLTLEFKDFKISRSLKKSMNKFEYKFDTNFEAVIRGCKEVPRDANNGTWIQEDIVEAYVNLHNMGVAHSVESYLDGELVGGAYGIVVGKLFCGESMFAKVSDASKSAFATLVKHLQEWGYEFIDCQVPTDHLKSLGAKEITRDEFLAKLKPIRYETLEHLWVVNKKQL